MKTYATALVCHQSQKKSRSDDGVGLATHLEEMEITAQIAPAWALKGKGREEDRNQQRERLEVVLKQLGWNSWKMADNAARNAQNGKSY